MDVKETQHARAIVAKDMWRASRQDDHISGVEAHGIGLVAFGPGLHLAFEDEQCFDIGMPVQQCGIALLAVCTPVKMGFPSSSVSR